jgi:DNA-binding NarL/FixJ family response regulator
LGTVQKQEQSEPIRVLLAEGRRAPRRRAAAALRADERFELCACVADAPSAVAASLEHEPDVCVLDLGMPGGGIAAAREIAARLPGSRILMLADIPAGEEGLFAALGVGASGYLPKATQSEALLDAVARVAAGDAALSDDLVMRLIEAFRDPDRPRRRVLGERLLTAREWQVLHLLRQGLSTGEIAEELVVSPVTVRSHFQAIQRKLDVPDRGAALALFELQGRTAMHR